MKIVDKAVKKVYLFNCSTVQIARADLRARVRNLRISVGRLANSFAQYARRTVILHGLIFGRKRCTKVRTRNNYNSLYERRVTTMSNLKNVIIYLLSVLIAFESGVLLFIVGMFTVTNDLKNDRKNRSVSYRSYRKGD